MQSNALAAWLAGKKPEGKVYYIGPDYEMGRNAVASFRKQAELNKLQSVGIIDLYRYQDELVYHTEWQ